MQEKQCELCNRKYEYDYSMFGRSCIDNLYKMLSIRKPGRLFKDKEKYLLKRIAWKNKKIFLSTKNQKVLARKYIELNYLEKMNLLDFEEEKNEIKADIEKINFRRELIEEKTKTNLHTFYEIYKNYKKFAELIATLKEQNWLNSTEITMEDILEKFKFIFNEKVDKESFMYKVLSKMQYIFWNLVADIGEKYFDYVISANFLRHSLEENPENINVKEGDIVSTIKKDEQFNEFIGQNVRKNSAKDSFEAKTYLKFDNKDLYFALHIVDIKVKGTRDDEKYNCEVSIKDTYDYTDFKDVEEYYEDANSVAKSIFSSTINNFAYISQQCFNIIKKYEITIEFTIKEEVI